MKLTKYDKTTMARSLFRDFPDFSKTKEGVRVKQVINEYLRDNLPAEIYSAYNNRELRKYLSLHNGPVSIKLTADQAKVLHAAITNMRRSLIASSVWESHAPSAYFKEIVEVTPIEIEVARMKEEGITAFTDYLKIIYPVMDVYGKICSVLTTCSTLNIAKERLPKEVHRYLPTDNTIPSRGSSDNLPALYDLGQELRVARWLTPQSSAS